MSVSELDDQEKALLRRVFTDARMSRLREVTHIGSGSSDADIAEAVADVKAMTRLEIKILHPPIEVDWDATRVGRRIARRDARRARRAPDS